MFRIRFRSASLAFCPIFALTAMASAAPPAFQQAISSSAPILYYQLNEISGPALNHGSLGAGFNATYLGAIQRGVPTQSGDTGAIFTTVNDYLESLTPSPASLNGNPTFTAETLVAIRCNGTYTFYPPFLHWGTGGSGNTGAEVFFSLQSNHGDDVYVGFFNGGLATQSPTPIGQWMHLVWVRQGGGNASTGSTLYLNGQPVALTPDLTLCCSDLTPSVTSSVFRVNRGSDLIRFTTMEMDELALYDRAFAPAEVAAHYAALFTQSTLKGDLDCDTFVTGHDVDGFITALLAPADYPAKYPMCNALNGDFNNSGSVTTADIPPFIARLISEPTTPFQQAVLNDSPSLFYSMNDAGNLIPNRGSLGPAFDAIRTGDTSLVPSPSGDGGIFFPGQNNFYVTAAQAPAAFTGNPTFTAEAIVKPECTVVAYPSMLGWGTAGTGQEVFFGFSNNDAAFPYAGFYDGGLKTSNSIPHAQWVHVVWTRQAGGNASTGSTLYIDGQPVTAIPDPILCCNATVPNVTSTGFRINIPANGSRYFVGSLDELALYDHLLTPAQVLTHYNTLPH